MAVREAFQLLFWCVKTSFTQVLFFNYWTFEKAVVRLEEFRFALRLKKIT